MKSLHDGLEIPKVDNDSPLKGTLQIKEFYAGKTIFMTGITGFLGKVVFEKLLRSCSDFKKIIVMIRTKKGVSSEERFKELVSSPCFNNLRNQLGPKEFIEFAKSKI